MDQIPYPYLYLFYLTTINIDTNNQIQKFIYICILNRYGYKSDYRNMDINIDINQMIKLYDYVIKDITEWMINQINSILI